MMRSKAREVAMQLLFQYDTNKVRLSRGTIVGFARRRLRDNAAVEFALELYDGVLKQQSEIDQLISRTSDKWKLHRLLPVDRNVLRLGTFELLHASEQTPIPIVINEAIELSRRFGGKDSPQFVNGILGKICELRPGATPAVRTAETASTNQVQEPTPTAPPAADPADKIESADLLPTQSPATPAPPVS